MTRFRSALFIALCSVADFIGAESTAARYAKAAQTSNCYSCRISNCGSSEATYIGTAPDVTRCVEHDQIPPARCATTAVKLYQTNEGGVCFVYGCASAISNGQSCTYIPPQ